MDDGKAEESEKGKGGHVLKLRYRIRKRKWVLPRCGCCGVKTLDEIKNERIRT